MKKTLITIFAAVAAIAAITSCQKENLKTDDGVQAGTRTETITLSSDPIVKTTLGEDGLSVNWVDGDAVAIITYNETDNAYGKIKSSVTIANDGTASATYEVPDGYVAKYVSYPHIATSRYETNIGVRTSAKATMIAVKNNFPTVNNLAQNLSLGVIDGSNASVQNLLALLKFEITSEDVKILEFTGNKEEFIAGYLYFDPEQDFAYTSAYNGTTSITMKELEQGMFYLPINPIQFIHGFTIKLKDASENVLFTYTTSKNVTFTRNKIYDLGIESAWREDIGENIVIKANFNNRGAEWPFTTEAPDEESTVAANGAEQGGYFLYAYPAYEFAFCLQNWVDGDSCRITNGGGLRFGSTTGDYLKLPAIENYALTSVKATTRYNNSISIEPMTTEETIEGGAMLNNKNVFTFNLTGTNANTSYKLVDQPVTKVDDDGVETTTPTLLSITSLTLTYSPVTE